MDDWIGELYAVLYIRKYFVPVQIITFFSLQVKVDESLSLDHVTRSRPKGNRGRRPPTRIHMKEVGEVD